MQWLHHLHGFMTFDVGFSNICSDFTEAIVGKTLVPDIYVGCTTFENISVQWVCGLGRFFDSQFGEADTVLSVRAMSMAGQFCLISHIHFFLLY
jgi:hypothetical protein